MHAPFQRLLSRVLLLAPLLAAFLRLPAQEAGAPPPIDIQFRCLGWRIAPGPPFEFFNGTEWKSIDDLNTFHRSREPYTYTGPNPVVFYRRNAEGERVPVCQVDFSRNLLQPLLLFVQQRQGDFGTPRFQSLVFEDHDSRFPPGSFQFVNMTTLELSGKLGGAAFQLAPGQQLNFAPGLPASQRAVHLLLAHREASGGLRVLQSSYMQYDADTKHLTFVLPHPNGRGNVNTFTITEQKTPEREAPPGEAAPAVGPEPE